MNSNLSFFSLFLMLMLVACSPNKNDKNSTAADEKLEILSLEELQKHEQREAELTNKSFVDANEVEQSLLNEVDLEQVEAETLLLQQAKLKKQQEEVLLLEAADLKKEKNLK